MSRRGLIFEAPGADSRRDRLVREVASTSTTIVPVDQPSDIPEVARGLADAGVRLIELYGGFSSSAISRILEVVDGRSAVGAGSFAVDALAAGDLA